MRAVLLGVLASLAFQVAAPATQPKLIQERYPSGGIRIECEITVDGHGNVVNDGLLRKWNPAGTVVVEGRYANGKRIGHWVRWLNREDAEVLFTAPFDRFESPFVSHADFVEGQMDGEWTIADARGRWCSRVTLKNGKRNGPSTLWLPDGRVFRQAQFVNGLPSGELCEIGPDGTLTAIAAYADGRQVVNNIAYFPEREDKHIEATHTVAVVSPRAPDDFAQTRFAQYTVRKKTALHGPWRSWYSNGQLQCEGNYVNDREAGMFTWWHANGARAAEGLVVDGQPVGVWSWWYADGQKAAEAEFSHNAVAGEMQRTEQSGETSISASFTPKGRAAVTRKIRQLY
jgi:antitoxin component YwqK of YwqJK toxin-antitoxin module